jgi:uncharacterized protein (TIGR02646 family)
VLRQRAEKSVASIQREHWRRFGGNSRDSVKRRLEEMAGDGKRCMYCSDSCGDEIEHFWPKTTYPDRMYDWRNLLLSCGACNLIKGEEFPIERGAPLLIEPTTENPWEYLDFDPTLGTLQARFDPNADGSSHRGAGTHELLQLNRECLERGNKNAWNHLTLICRQALESQGDTEEVVRQLREADTRDFLGWALTGTGLSEPPFPELRQRRPDVWAALNR